MRVQLYGQEKLSAREMGEKGAPLTISEHPHFAHHDSPFGNSSPNTYASLWIHRTLKFSAPWLKVTLQPISAPPKSHFPLSKSPETRSWPLWSCHFRQAQDWVWFKHFARQFLNYWTLCRCYVHEPQRIIESPELVIFLFMFLYQWHCHFPRGEGREHSR